MSFHWRDNKMWKPEFPKKRETSQTSVIVAEVAVTNLDRTTEMFNDILFYQQYVRNKLLV